jgi:hypothetical protein
MYPPIQKLLHAVDMLCIDYYEACERKNRANSWNGCHSRVGASSRSVSTASAEKNLLGFRARASRISSLMASGRGGPRYCGGQPTAKRVKNGRASPTTRYPGRRYYPLPGAREAEADGLRAVQSSPFPPFAPRRRGGPGGGLGTPGLTPGPRPPRPHLRKR